MRPNGLVSMSASISDVSSSVRDTLDLHIIANKVKSDIDVLAAGWADAVFHVF